MENSYDYNKGILGPEHQEFKRRQDRIEKLMDRWMFAPLGVLTIILVLLVVFAYLTGNYVP